MTVSVGVRSFASSFALAVALHPSLARAEEADESTNPPGEVVSDEINVTTQKREERLSDVPMSITALSAEQLQSRGITTTVDLARIIPGFAAQRTNNGLPIYFIRSDGFLDASLGVSPFVTVYSDQAPIPFTHMARGAILDLERVEVLKGPQETLFG